MRLEQKQRGGQSASTVAHGESESATSCKLSLWFGVDDVEIEAKQVSGLPRKVRFKLLVLRSVNGR